MINKGNFIESLTKEEFDKGLIKFNIPNEEDIYSPNGEGVWGWVTLEEKVKYHDDKYTGELIAILLNTPLNYFGVLNWGDEVKLKCHGINRPTLDPNWVKENLK